MWHLLPYSRFTATATLLFKKVYLNCPGPALSGQAQLAPVPPFNRYFNSQAV